MIAGDTVEIEDYKGRMRVKILGFHVDCMVIDDGLGDLDSTRTCDPSNVVSTEKK